NFPQLSIPLSSYQDRKCEDIFVGHSESLQAEKAVRCSQAMSVFKPFIFVEDVKAVPKVQSSCAEDCHHEHSEYKHELYEAHQCAISLMDNDKEAGDKLLCTMLDLEKQGIDAMEDMLNSSNPIDPAEVVDLFYDCVDTEIKFYK
ncbi:hypothetical protein AB205_0163690, partial [Aquarana catesbeiana]